MTREIIHFYRVLEEEKQETKYSVHVRFRVVDGACTLCRVKPHHCRITQINACPAAQGGGGGCSSFIQSLPQIHFNFPVLVDTTSPSSSLKYTRSRTSPTTLRSRDCMLARVYTHHSSLPLVPYFFIHAEALSSGNFPWSPTRDRLVHPDLSTMEYC